MTRVGGLALWWALFYLIIALVAAPLFINGGEGFVQMFMSKRVFVFVAISAVAWVLPVIIDKLPLFIQDNMWFQILIALSPPWLIFLIFSGEDNKALNVMRKIWILIWIFLLIVTAIGVISKTNVPTELQGQYDFKPLEAFGDVADYVKDSVGGAVRRLIGVPGQLGTFVKRNLNDSIGHSFMGQVDPYSERDLGVQFTEIRTFSSEFYEGEEVVVWADIQGETFKDIIRLNMRCYAVGPEKQVYDGIIETNGVEQDLLVIKMREKIGVQCRFDDLPAGYYDVRVAGAFNFRTWAYVPYYFAPDELIKGLWAQDLDPAAEAGIPSRPVAIYTNGPVQLGLASEYDQPIPVDPSDPVRALPPFGASVINQWADGEVSQVRYISLLVPDEFTLVKCDRDPVRGSREQPGWSSNEETGYREYRFENIQNPNMFFESATCFLSLEGGSLAEKQRTAQRLVGGYDLVMKTFAAKTEYLYTIEDGVRVQVKEKGVGR
ncbi:hypothetical protein GF367_01460 [Candidatus Woesearchaeota archaeon]|nr:hypothetical protein [Candidatus Woesearchaeota archaeon]